MCGILGMFVDGSVEVKKVVEQLKQLEYRGYDSWGVAALLDNADENKLYLHKQVGSVDPATVEADLQTQAVIGHTRWATHGGVNETNAHPHLDTNNRITVVHNGIVENFSDLKKELEDKGIKFQSATDSEVIAQLIGLYLEQHNLPTAVAKTVSKLSGLNAVVVMDMKTGQLAAVTTGSSLLVGVKDNQESQRSLTFTSDILGLPKGCQFARIPQYQVLVSTLDAVKPYQVFDISLGEIKAADLLILKELEAAAAEAKLGKAASYLEKELLEQPAVISHQFSNAQLSQLSERIEQAQYVYLVGCGTAYHAALFGEYLMRNHFHKSVQAVIGSEFKHCYANVTKNSYCVFFSQSGETADIVEHARYLDDQEIEFGAITNVASSSLAALANQVILLSAGAEKCVLATKSFTAMLATVLSLCEERLDEKTNMQMQHFLLEIVHDGQLDQLAATLSQQTHIFSLGKGGLLPIAYELALKIKEVTYLHVEALPAGELKHGTISLIEDGVPVIVLVPDGEEKQEMLSSAQEVRSRGAMVIGIANQSDDVFDVYVPIPKIADFAPLAITFVAQVLAWKIAQKLGRDLDKPRNLAKSVTVK